MGIEPTRPSYQDGKLPLHHRGVSSVFQSAIRNSQERPVGVEPTRPPWQGDRLPLHHGRGCHRASGGSCTRVPTVARWRVRCYTTDTVSRSGGSRTHVIPLKRRAPSRLSPHFQAAPPMGFEPTTFPVTGERPLRAGLRGRVSCRGGSRTHAAALSERCLAAWLPHNAKLAELSKTAPTVPRAGVEPDLGGLKDRRPHRKSNGAQHGRQECLPHP